MNQTFHKINEDITSYIKNLEEKYQHDSSQITEMAIQFISGRLEFIKEKFESIQDLTAEDEIFYFKNIKCHLLALLQYYYMVQKIEIKKPAIPLKKIKKYYLKALYKIKSKISDNHFYYNYYKTNSNKLDQQFFRRLKNDFFLPNDDMIIDIDKRYTTPSVYIFANVEALEMTRHYLKKKIKTNCTTHITVKSGQTKLKWTASKADLIESIYALHSSGVFNNGKADLKEIAEYFQEIFDLDLGQYNRVFFDIRARKNNKTKFLDALKDSLAKRIKDTDNEIFP